MAELTIPGSRGPDQHLAQELVRVLLADEPTGEEPLMAILEYALRALLTRPVLAPGQEPTWTVG
ncbi:MAG TPA: hypothetical protein VKT31_00635 [Solirubrobacteraceae bacterium]|nr:hypothetical protein [Solirubrobacteraceae bacterium]